jgi:hypothetical protein
MKNHNSLPLYAVRLQIIIIVQTIYGIKILKTLYFHVLEQRQHINFTRFM